MGIAAVALAAGAGLYMYWHGGGDKGRKERKEEVSSDEPYERSYPLSMSNEAVCMKETDQNITDGVVEEVTPKGRLIMRYMESDNTFQYWSDKSQDYRHLEVAARKYVILFNCQDQYVDMVDELVKERDSRLQRAVQDGAQEAQPSVFATFKRYATKDSRKIANEKANVYKWKGKVSEYASADETTECPQPVIRYSEYKRKI